ncbi:SHOCT domain-containing protein [Streptomyces sp. NBC_01264]|uniref:SHOCT domain-containing protein n=1 Tax=Streptomyces sp. NBC_01264 TaxID=2903804 RepID=UPI00225B7ADC|nr:SHOCT domain-containing protein [Streptomyces sp. NBC_01264]MCX4781039.1 SHOCT domain-containing protein [Streptomyces sp. NBC_01264]
MFIRPIGSVVNPSQRPSGHPLLRGILARGAYVWDTAQHPAAAAAPPPPDGTAPDATAPAPAPGATPNPPPAPAPSPPAAPSARREPAAARPAPHTGQGAPGPASPGADLTDRLTRLAGLAREGLLTPEEFTAAKARLLAD